MKCKPLLFTLHLDESPLAEGRELKYLCNMLAKPPRGSPLAEGRELKCVTDAPEIPSASRRPSRRGVN